MEQIFCYGKDPEARVIVCAPHTSFMDLLLVFVSHASPLAKQQLSQNKVVKKWFLINLYLIPFILLFCLLCPITYKTNVVYIRGDVKKVIGLGGDNS